MDYSEMDLFMDQSLSGVVFVVDGQRVPAFKPILSFKSRVFRAMFLGKFSESEESKIPEIEIKETTVDAFKTLIRFIYTDELKLKDDNDLQHIFDVYQLSDRYEVLKLGERVVQHFESIINVKDLTSISRFVFNHNIEELIAKVMAFIETNINELIEWDLKGLKELNDWTNDKLLDVLLTSDRLESNDNFKHLVINKFSEKKKVFVKKDVLSKNMRKGNLEELVLQIFVDQLQYDSYDVFKTFVGYLYFDKLILKDEEDFQLIREVCGLFCSGFECKSFFDCIQNHLKDRISVENLESISRIALFYGINGLMKRVNEFIEQNFTEIMAKSDEQLSQINHLSGGKLFSIFSTFIRKSLQNNV